MSKIIIPKTKPDSFYFGITVLILASTLVSSCTSNPLQPITHTSQQEGHSYYSWAKGGSGAEGGQGNSIAVDKTGNCYVVGSFFHQIILDSITLNDNSMLGSFFAKYDANGNILWAIPGNIDKINFLSVLVDDSQNIYLGGKFSSGSKITNGVILTQDASILKLDQKGNLIWSIPLPNSVGKIRIDSGGNIYVSAQSIYKISPSGVIQYTITSGNQNMWLNDLNVNGNGELYITGRVMTGGIAFGNIIINTTVSKDLFLAKFDAYGNCVWAKNYGFGINKNDSGGAGICTDRAGNVYLSGYFEQEYNIEGFHLTTPNGAAFFLASYASDGKIKWLKNINAFLTSNGALKIDSRDYLYISGGYFNDLNFQSLSFSPAGNSLFVAKVDVFGNGIWIENAECVDPAFVTDLFVDNAGNCFLTGQYQSGITLGSTSLSGSGLQFFLAKLNAH